MNEGNLKLIAYTSGMNSSDRQLTLPPSPTAVNSARYNAGEASEYQRPVVVLRVEHKRR